MKIKVVYKVCCKTNDNERLFICYSLCDLLTFLEDPCEAYDLVGLDVYKDDKLFCRWDSKRGYYED